MDKFERQFTEDLVFETPEEIEPLINALESADKRASNRLIPGEFKQFDYDKLSNRKKKALKTCFYRLKSDSERIGFFYNGYRGNEIINNFIENYIDCKNKWVSYIYDELIEDNIYKFTQDLKYALSYEDIIDRYYFLNKYFKEWDK